MQISRIVWFLVAAFTWGIIPFTGTD